MDCFHRLPSILLPGVQANLESGTRLPSLVKRDQGVLGRSSKRTRRSKQENQEDL